MMVDSMICDGKFSNEKTGYSVVFDDDGRVAYAYLLNADGRIVADVWLYNRCETPIKPEWPDQDKMPFANPQSYAKDHSSFLRVNDISDVFVEWHDAPMPGAHVFIRGELFAILLEGGRPGLSRMAKKDGPLAKVLEST